MIHSTVNWCAMKSRPAALLFCASLTLSTAMLASEPLAPPASYADSVAAFQQQSAKSSGPQISDADRETMARAKLDLAELMPDPGLAVGTRAPDFTLPNAFGKPVNLYAQLEKGPVVLSFYRGAWCPFCNLQLKGLRDSLAHFESHNARLIAITPQTPDKSLEQVKKEGYPFEILSDLDSEVMKAYGLYFEVPEDLSDVYRRNFALDLATYNGPGRYVLPVPGTYVIDTRGTIRAAFAETDYTRRMEPAAIVAALETL
ncbi:MAG: peroxiredoxin-like family protein [Pseudomonadota bacterium]